MSAANNHTEPRPRRGGWVTAAAVILIVEGGLGILYAPILMGGAEHEVAWRTRMSLTWRNRHRVGGGRDLEPHPGGLLSDLAGARTGAAGPELGRDVLDHSVRATFTAADQRRCAALVRLPAA